MLQTYSVLLHEYEYYVLYIYIIQKKNGYCLCVNTVITPHFHLTRLFIQVSLQPPEALVRNTSAGRSCFFCSSLRNTILGGGLGISFGSVEPYDCPLGSLILSMFEALVQSCRAEIQLVSKGPIHKCMSGVQLLLSRSNFIIPYKNKLSKSQ